MKIALVSQEYPPETARGGIGSQTYTKAHGLAKLGHEVFVISRSIDAHRHENKKGNITVIRIPGMENSLPEMTDIVQWITHSVVISIEIEALHKSRGLDIIDFPEWAGEGYTYLLNRTEWNTIPTAIQLHGPLVMFSNTIGWPEINSEFYKVGTHMESTCVQLSDAVYSSSECSARWIRKYYNYKKENIPVIHLGVDTIKFSPQKIAKADHPTVIFIGKLVANKGIEELIESVSNLVIEFPDLQLNIIGTGEEKYIQRLKEKAKSLGTEKMLLFRGFIDKASLPNELSHAHIFAAPSYYEGGPGFVYLEAMACGLPVIGCSGSGLDEIIQQEVNGMLVPPKDVVALTNTFSKMLKDHKFSEQMGMNARDYILNECDSDQCLKKLENFYYSVIKKCSEQKENI